MSLLRRTPVSIGRAERERRDDRFFVVASEDTHAPAQYFMGLDFSRVKVVVLPTPEGSGLSSPGHVVDRLKEAFQHAKQSREIQEDDEFWVFLDTDHHIRDTHLRGTTEALSQARHMGFEIAVSNPCFELWLLLHHVDVPLGTEIAGCAEIEAKLKQTLAGYNKAAVNSAHFPPALVPDAIRRARALESNPDAPEGHWPEKAGTRIYRLMERIVGKRAA